MTEIGEVRELDITERLRYQHVMVGAAMGNWLDANKALPVAQEAAVKIDRLRHVITCFMNYPHMREFVGSELFGIGEESVEK